MKLTIEKLNKLIENSEIMWNDPDPIIGNDYTVRSIVVYEEDDFKTALIMYGSDTKVLHNNSEAEIFISELLCKSPEGYKRITLVK